MSLKFGHGKDQSQDEAQKAAENVAVQAKAGHAAGEPLTKAAGLRKEATNALAEMQKRASKLEDRAEDLCGRLERIVLAERSAQQDTFVAAPAKGATQTLEQAQQYAREQVEAGEWKTQLERVRASLAEATDALRYAAAAMATRQPAAEQVLYGELTKDATTARDRDMKEGRSADEQMKRQQGRDETVESHLKALAERDLADTARLKAFEEDLGTQISSLLRSQEDLAQRADLSGTERLTGAREALSRFEESWRASLAMKLLFDGRFSDIEAVKNTWERAVKEVRAKAAQDQKNTPEEFEKVRAKFWEILNAPERSTNEREARDVHEVRRLLDLARVEWQSGSSAPLLKMQSESVDRIREASRRGDAQAQRWERDMDRNLLLSIDHVADKNTHRELTQDAANLRLMAVPDNSARGAWFDVSDRRKADFLRPETQQVRNDKRRDTARRQSADRSQDELQAKEIMLAPERLRQDQHRAQTAHDRAMLAAKDRDDLKLTELRDASLNKLDDESEAARLARRENLLDVLERFQRSSREQLETLKTYEAGVHERQHQDLGKALATLDAASTFSDAARQLGSITKRLAEERRGVEALWGEMARQQSQNEALLLQAIYGARSREVQEEQLERAVAEQEKTRSFLQARLDEAKRNERMDD